MTKQTDVLGNRDMAGHIASFLSNGWIPLKKLDRSTKLAIESHGLRNQSPFIEKLMSLGIQNPLLFQHNLNTTYNLKISLRRLLHLLLVVRQSFFFKKDPQKHIEIVAIMFILFEQNLLSLIAWINKNNINQLVAFFQDATRARASFDFDFLFLMLTNKVQKAFEKETQDSSLIANQYIQLYEIRSTLIKNMIVNHRRIIENRTKFMDDSIMAGIGILGSLWVIPVAIIAAVFSIPAGLITLASAIIVGAVLGYLHHNFSYARHAEANNSQRIIKELEQTQKQDKLIFDEKNSKKILKTTNHNISLFKAKKNIEIKPEPTNPNLSYTF